MSKKWNSEKMVSNVFVQKEERSKEERKRKEEGKEGKKRNG